MPTRRWDAFAPPVLKITGGVLTPYENSLLYLILQSVASTRLYQNLIQLAAF